MRCLSIAIVACVLPIHALADTSSAWDSTYERESSGGSELCPVASAPVSVAGGKFSITWNISVGNRAVPVGRIEGTARDSGEVVLAVKLAEPLPAAVVEMMRDSGDLGQLRSKASDMKLSFRSMRSNRELRLSSGMCYASWTAKPAPPPPAATPPASDPVTEEIEPPPAPAPTRRTKATSKAKAPVKAAPPKAVAKPAKVATPVARPAKSAPVKAGSSTPSPRSPTKEEPRKRGRSNGATCSYASDCESANCEYRKCTSTDRMSKKLGNGFACTYASDCASGNCEYRKCASSGRGGKELGTGADCVYGDDCASGSCNYHKCVDD
jgi:hypothetical protein